MKGARPRHGRLATNWWQLRSDPRGVLKAADYLIACGSLTRLKIAPLYGSALLQRIFPFRGGQVAITPGQRLSRFATGGSDLVYLATDLGLSR